MNDKVTGCISIGAINTVNDVIKVLDEIPSRFYSLTDHFY
jgi:hypothetical protein